jgi:putative FmdB family regulatory protein
MPLFEYKCRECEHEFETLVTARTADSVRCVACESTSVERLIALPALGRVVETNTPTNCAGNGPPCGASWCGRKS